MRAASLRRDLGKLPIRLPSLCSLQQPPPPPPPRTLAPVCLLREDPASLNFLHFLSHRYGNHRLALFRHFSLKEGTRGRVGVCVWGGEAKAICYSPSPEGDHSQAVAPATPAEGSRWGGGSLFLRVASAASSKRGWKVMLCCRSLSSIASPWRRN